MTQEVSVQTSNFGAEAVRGPVVINTVSKSGTSSYHGEGYLYVRNDILNANDWQSNHAGNPGAAHITTTRAETSAVPSPSPRRRCSAGSATSASSRTPATPTAFSPSSPLPICSPVTSLTRRPIWPSAADLDGKGDQRLQRSNRDSSSGWNRHRTGLSSCRHHPARVPRSRRKGTLQLLAQRQRRPDHHPRRL